MTEDEERQRKRVLRQVKLLEGPVSLLQMAVRDVALRLQSFREVLPADEWTSRVEPAVKRLVDATVELLETVRGPYRDGGDESQS